MNHSQPVETTSLAASHHRVRTLWLCGLLHAFTHIYHVALLPLYLLIQKDLGLSSVEKATLLVTVMMVAYFVPSYLMGVLADRYSRKMILGLGLAINAAGFMGLAYARDYPSALLCTVIAGLGGSFYHPAATALVARLYPVGTGKALGFVGMGASAGFFFSPIYTGWRAEMTGNWRAPVWELGLLGLIMSGIFTWLAQEHGAPAATPERGPAKEGSLFPRPALWFAFICASFAFSLRDFTGSSMASLGSLFLQKAHGYDLRHTGVALSSIFLMAMISNPLFGGMSDRGRMRWICLTLIVAGLCVAAFPHVPEKAVLPAFAIYGFFFMANYPMVEAALMESVPDAIRGRIFGFFITIGGLVGNLAHWAMGAWVKNLGTTASSVAHYYPIYFVLAGLVLLSLLGLPCLMAIRKREAGLEMALAGGNSAEKQSIAR